MCCFVWIKTGLRKRTCLNYFHLFLGQSKPVEYVAAFIVMLVCSIPNISYSFKSKRLAVGARNGQVAVYDLKQGRTQIVNAHTHPVTVLNFSEDGKLLATYAYADSVLNVWQVSTGAIYIKCRCNLVFVTTDQQLYVWY